MKTEDVVIIGGGPAGAACALQFKRYDIYPLLIEKHSIGGLLQNANSVDNYPGFPYGISGTRLCGLIEKQLNNNKVRILKDEVKSVSFFDENFIIKTASKEIDSRYLVIASGTTPVKIPKWSDIEEQGRLYYELRGAEAPENMKIAIIGGGDAAFDYALSLSGKNKVKILNRSSELKCNDSLKSEVFSNNSIDYLSNATVKKISLENDKLLLTCRFAEGEKEITLDYLFAAIGRKPEASFMSEEIKRIESELIKRKKLHYIGDVNNGIYRQTAISAGNGVKAAMEIYGML